MKLLFAIAGIVLIAALPGCASARAVTAAKQSPCTTPACIAASAQASLAGTGGAGGNVAVKAPCDPASVTREPGGYAVTCDVSYRTWADRAGDPPPVPLRVKVRLP